MAAASPAPYVPPSWSTAPKHESWRLEVIKDGLVAETLDISRKPYYILGRNAESVDIMLAHESISRAHAALQFDERGQLYIVDLGSTHGTKLNSSKEKLKPRSYTLCPAGSILRFGESTRLYNVLGPQEFGLADAPLSESKQAFVEASEQRQARKAAEKEEAKLRAKQEEESRGVTLGNHGMMDEVSSDNNGSNLLLYVDEDGLPVEGIEGSARAAIKRLEWLEEIPASSTLSDRDRDILERVRAKLLKAKSYCHEMDRVKGKDKEKRKPKLGRAAAAGSSSSAGLDEVLSDAQRSQLARLEEALEKVLTPLENDEELLRERLRSKNLLSAATLRKLEACDEARLSLKGSFGARAGSKFGGRESKEASYLSALANDEEVEDMTSTAVVAGKKGPTFKISKAPPSASSSSSSLSAAASAAAAAAPRPVPAAPAPSKPASTIANDGSISDDSPLRAEDLEAAVPEIFGKTKKSKGSAAPTYEALVVALEGLRARMDTLAAEIEAEEAAEQEKKEAVTGDDADDELASYLRANEEAVQSQLRQERKRRLRTMQKAEAHLEAMVDAAQPAASSSLSFLEDFSAQPPEHSGDSHADGVAEESQEADEVEPPAAKRQRTEEPSPVPQAASVIAATGGTSAAKAAGGLAAVFATATSASPAAPKPIAAPARPAGAAPASAPFEAKESAWVPPVGQRGDGRTALNEKLGY